MNHRNYMIVILIFLVAGMITLSCSRAGEKKTEAGSESASDSTHMQPVPGKDTGAQGTTQVNPAPAGQLPPIAIGKPGDEITPDPNAPRRVIKLHPVDSNDPRNKMMKNMSKDAFRSQMIPLGQAPDPKMKQAETLAAEGTKKAMNGDNEGAIGDFTKSLEIYPSASTFMKRGYAYLLLQDYRTAMTDLNEAIKQNPKLDRAYFARGVCRFEQQDFTGAQEDMNRFIEKDKKNPMAYNYLAGIRFMQKDFKGALDYYDQVVQLDPNYPDVYTNRGMMKHYTGDLKGAIADYDESLKKKPENPTAYSNRGAAKFMLQDYVGALGDLNSAIRLNPDFADAYDNRGKAKYKLGDTNGACKDWNKAYSLGLEASRELIIKFCK
jgi:tetratricopeptide (TPR) repeat protein